MSTQFPAESAVIVLRIAGREGPAFPLDSAGRNVIGRAEDALVAVADRLASRNHAAIRFDPANRCWRLEDLGSRNGTWLDGAPVATATLAPGSVIRVGTTELVFRPALPSPPADDPAIIRCGLPGDLEGPAVQRAVAAGDGRWSMLLYQACIRLLAAASPEEIVATTLELAAEFTTATSFGWFRCPARDRLEPVCVVPPGSGLNSRMTGRAAQEATAGRAVWLAQADGTATACVPLAAGPQPAAVLAAASPNGLREADFDVLLTLATLATAAQAGRERPAEPMAATTGPLNPLRPEPPGDPERPDDGTISLTPETVRAWQVLGQAQAVMLPSEATSLRIEEWERALALEAFRRSNGNVPAAAALLGVSRATLYRRLEAWGLTRDDPSPAPD